jgi:hypothetical protein
MDAATAMFAGGGSSSTALAASGPLGGFGASSAAGGGLMLAGEGMSLGGMGSMASMAIPGVGWAMAGLTVAQGLMKLSQSRQEAAIMEEQALWGDFNARQEILRGRQGSEAAAVSRRPATKGCRRQEGRWSVRRLEACGRDGHRGICQRSI